MTFSEQIIRTIKDKYPWLVAEWNGKEWESERDITRRRINALESHIQDLESRFSEQQNALNVHTQGTRHRPPRPKEPAPDTD